jgi:hypothetical protein
VRYNHAVPYRIAAPPQPDPADVEHPYAAVLRAQRRRARLLSVVVVLIAGAGITKVVRSGRVPHRFVMTEATRADGARRAIDGARSRASLAQVNFETGVRAAIGQGVVPRSDLGVCPITLVESSAVSTPAAAFPLLTIDRADIAQVLPSQAVAGVLADVHRAEVHLTAGRYEEAALYARALDRPERFGYEVVLLAAKNKPPRARSGAEYEPGEIEGRAYLYDFASGRVVCAGDVHAKSSSSIGYTFSDRPDAPTRLSVVASMSDAVTEDMRKQTERAIVDAMKWRAGQVL